ncbi:MAG: DUF6359 domain-containing protein [Candidatus Cryptobacteroides sp.]
MKRESYFCRAFLAFAMFLPAAMPFQGCVSGLDDGKGEIRLSFSPEYRYMTRSGIELPDTADFLLTVRDQSGETVYDGRYGDIPESFRVKVGSCTVSIISKEFTSPAFDAPQFGDEQCVVVPSDGVVSVKLVCSQVNCGVRLRIAPEYLESYPESVLFLKSAQGRLMYGYSEKRTAYFLPGTVSLVMVTGSDEDILMTRTLLSREMLSVGVSVAASAGGEQSKTQGISVSIDTSRVWNETTCVIGGSGTGGSDSDDALTIAQAKESIGAEDVWVCAYIVGGDLTSASASFDPPFSSRTNILVGPRSTIADRSSGMSVQLPSGSVRDALNLVDNPELLGARVMIKGDIVESYFGLPGIKNVTEYRLF